MNHSKLYVPDPNVWINFFKSKSRKKIINQKGGSNILSAKKSAEPLNVELVSPVEAANERTESVIKRMRPKSKRRGKKRINTKKRTKTIRRKKTVKTKRNKSVKLKPKPKRKSSKKRDIFSR